MNLADINQKLFFEKVKKTETCWLWIGAIFKGRGYGQFAVKRHPQKAHRVSWVIRFGSVPNNLGVLHSCDTPLCVNPDHLWLGTALDNAQDMVNKGRQKFNPDPPKGEESPHAILNTEQVLFIIANRGIISQRKLARLFGVGQTTIRHIQKRDTWKHLDKE